MESVFVCLWVEQTEFQFYLVIPVLHTPRLNIMLKEQNLENDIRIMRQYKKKILVQCSIWHFQTKKRVSRNDMKLVYIWFRRNCWRIRFSETWKKKRQKNKKYRSTGWNVGASECIDRHKHFRTHFFAVCLYCTVFVHVETYIDFVGLEQKDFHLYRIHKT